MTAGGGFLPFEEEKAPYPAFSPRFSALSAPFRRGGARLQYTRIRPAAQAPAVEIFRQEGLTNQKNSCILANNNTTNKYDDREKVPP